MSCDDLFDDFFDIGMEGRRLRVVWISQTERIKELIQLDFIGLHWPHVGRSSSWIDQSQALAGDVRPMRVLEAVTT